MEFRQRHEQGNQQIEALIDMHFITPPVNASSGGAAAQQKVFDDYLYLTQVGGFDEGFPY
jgi:hypothetical protein